MFKKENISQKIDNYFKKNKHERILTVFLDNFNNHSIYISFDYVNSIQAYKISWIDLGFINFKNMEQYVNSQIMTRKMGVHLDNLISKIKNQGENRIDNNIYEDRVSLSFKNEFGQHNYSFSRFLPKDWNELVDPIVILFAYLPRGMEVMLDEIMAPFSQTEEYFNSLKPIKYRLTDNKCDKLFRKDVIDRGTKYYEDGNILFLEYISNRYVALVKGKNNYIVTIEQINEDYTLMRCNCPCEYLCKHIYAVLLAIKNKEFHSFYKVVFTAKEESLLERITNGSFSLCCGVEDGNLLILTNDNEVLKLPIVFNGKKCFKVIEDDDNFFLSNYIEKF